MDMTIDGLIENAKSGSGKKRLLLHVCCAPCLCGVIERVLPYFDVTLFFYNPNITQNEEFNLRLDALKTLVLHFGNIKLIVPDQTPDEFYSRVEGLHNCPEGGARCKECFILRLNKTAEYFAAHKDEFDCFATTLTVSPHKNATLINEIGKASAARFGVDYAASDFKKQNGFLRSTTLSKELGIYRQDYCGCEYSNWHLNEGN